MSLVSTALAGGVLTVTLERAERGNALDAALVAELRAAVAQAEDPAVRLLVLRGAGKALCTGFDVGGIEAETDAGLLARFVAIELLLQAVRHAPVPTVALGHGRMFGAGRTCSRRPPGVLPIRVRGSRFPARGSGWCWARGGWFPSWARRGRWR